MLKWKKAFRQKSKYKEFFYQISFFIHDTARSAKWAYLNRTSINKTKSDSELKTNSDTQVYRWIIFYIDLADKISDE